jgi:hypothetical protein
MTAILSGNCERIFSLQDPDAPNEDEFEFVVGKALKCFMPKYHVSVFEGSFRLNLEIFRPDLVVVAKDFSHWFVVEVELVSHSLARHVLPQVRAFTYGDPLPDCSRKLAKALDVSLDRASALLNFVPRSVGVVANRRSREWEAQLSALGVSFLVVQSFADAQNNGTAVTVDGEFFSPSFSLGFGTYSAVDQALRFHKAVKVPEGDIQLKDEEGAVSIWTVRRNESNAWINKRSGKPALFDGQGVQLVKSQAGEILMRALEPAPHEYDRSNDK